MENGGGLNVEGVNQRHTNEIEYRYNNITTAKAEGRETLLKLYDLVIPKLDELV